MSRRKLDLVWIALSFSGMAILTAESQAKPEDFALVGVFFAVLTAISRAAYILATEKVGRAHSGYGRHGDGQRRIHAAGAAVPVYSERQ